jgi:hypothetical protein
MTKEYTCDVCDYITNDMSNYNRHKKSKRHKKLLPKYAKLHSKITLNSVSESESIGKNGKKSKSRTTIVKKVHRCEHCDEIFSRRDSLSRHKRTCSKKAMKDVHAKLETTERELIKSEEQVHYLRQLLLLSEVNKGTMSKFNHINTTFVNAKPLSILTYEKFKDNNEVKYINYDWSYEDKLIKDMLYNNKRKTLDKYIGKTIANIYLEEDPNKQKIWVTDCSRLKFIIRASNDNNSSHWDADTGGSVVETTIIDPVLEKFIEFMDAYFTRHCLPNPKKTYSMEERERMMQEQYAIMAIKDDIRDKSLHKKILKYMAPRFIIKEKH